MKSQDELKFISLVVPKENRQKFGGILLEIGVVQNEIEEKIDAVPKYMSNSFASTRTISIDPPLRIVNPKSRLDEKKAFLQKIDVLQDVFDEALNLMDEIDNLQEGTERKSFLSVALAKHLERITGFSPEEHRFLPESLIQASKYSYKDLADGTDRQVKSHHHFLIKGFEAYWVQELNQPIEKATLNADGAFIRLLALFVGITPSGVVKSYAKYKKSMD